MLSKYLLNEWPPITAQLLLLSKLGFCFFILHHLILQSLNDHSEQMEGTESDCYGFQTTPISATSQIPLLVFSALIPLQFRTWLSLTQGTSFQASESLLTPYSFPLGLKSEVFLEHIDVSSPCTQRPWWHTWCFSSSYGISGPLEY